MEKKITWVNIEQKSGKMESVRRKVIIKKQKWKKLRNGWEIKEGKLLDGREVKIMRCGFTTFNIVFHKQSKELKKLNKDFK